MNILTMGVSSLHPIPPNSVIDPAFCYEYVNASGMATRLPSFRDTRREREKPEYVLTALDRERIRLAQEKRARKLAAKKNVNK